MSGTNVSVLVPTGHRQVVKCNPNTTILQIIEEVCKKHGLNVDDFDVKHHNKVLDTTTIIRYSGLPNNAQLELTAAVKKRSETDITLALSLENGKRLMGNFKPNETLRNILNELCPENASTDKNPVVIYTRREIYGDDLETTTLKNLGLTSGRAMLRLIHKSPEELKVQANVSAPLPSKPVEEKPYKRTLIRSESPPPEPKTTDNKISKLPEDHKESKSKLHGQAPPKTGNIDILKLAREKRKIEGESLNKVDDKRTNNYIEEPEQSECKCEAMQVDENCSTSCEAKCNFTPNIKAEDEFVFLGSRNAMLFSLETAKAIHSSDLPDDFFELTLEDAKKILRDVKRQRMEMDNGPLLTSQMRNLEEAKRQLRQINKYKKAIIRIQFPDRNVLQGTFSPTDQIKDVIDFVREYLENKQLEFYIYSTPPKTILNQDSRLIEIGCVPGALLYFGSNDKGDKFLRKDLQDKFTTNSMASLAASKIRLENIRCTESYDDEKEIDEMESSNIPSTSGNAPNDYCQERKVVKTTENVPKWFKPSK